MKPEMGRLYRKFIKKQIIFSSAFIPLLFLLSAFSGSFHFKVSNVNTAEIGLEKYGNDVEIGDYEFNSNEIASFTNLKSASLKSLQLSKTKIIPLATDPHPSPSSKHSRMSRATGIDIVVSNYFQYEGIINELGPYAAGEVGKTTTFLFYLENIGDTDALNVEVIWRMLDYNNSESDKETRMISIPSSENQSISFDWTPQYSNYYNITLEVNADGDINESNNHQYWKWVFAVRWSADFEKIGIDDWEGQKGEGRWHITDTIENDPDSKAHSHPNALYHGEEGIPDDYGIGEDYYLYLPPFDLRRFEPAVPGTYLLYQFYGSSSTADKLTLEVKTSPDSEFELSGILPELSGDTKNEITQQFEWQVWQQENPNLPPGIPITIFTGEIVQFRFHWTSDMVTENRTGFYFDDFIIFGIEKPPSQKDVGLDELTLDTDSNSNEMYELFVQDEEIEISVKVKNYGLAPVNNFQVKLSIHDELNREVIKIESTIKSIPSLNTDGERILTWKFRPEICGNFYISIENLLTGDEEESNDLITRTFTAAKYYYDAENDNDSWEADRFWRRIVVPNDPEPIDHSRSLAWYFGDDNFSYGPNMNAILKSPIIDLQGVNPSKPEIKIFTNFMVYGNTAENFDILFFEYALDGSDNWKLVNDGGALGEDYTTVLSGFYGMQWYELNELKKVQVGSTDFIGHSVQFRWRFVSDHISENLPGYFIDDFIVWSIEEDYGRPSIITTNISKSELENQMGDSVLIAVNVYDRDDNILPGGITIDLTQLNGNKSVPLNDQGESGDLVADDGNYSIEIIGEPTFNLGKTILTVQVIDKNAKIGRGFINLEIIENVAPTLEEITPENREIQLNENENISFSVLATDPGDKLYYQWNLNGILIEEGEDFSEFLFQTNYNGNFSSGTYILNLTVFDDAKPPLSSYFEWEITVVDILPDFVLEESYIQISNTTVTAGTIVTFNVEIRNLGLKAEQNVVISMYENQSGSDSNSANKWILIDSSTITHFDSGSEQIQVFSWTAVFGIKEIRFVVDPDNDFVEISENNNEATLSIIVESPDVDNENPEKNTLISGIMSNSFYMMTVIMVVIATALFGFTVGGTEFGKYQLFAMMVPLYSRLKGTKILSHQLREQIYNHIKQYPGDHYRSIMNKLNVKNGTLVHHLTRLEQEELIKSQRDGLYKRFYPIGMKIPRSDVSVYYPDGTITYNISDSQVSEIQMNILRAINDKPGLTQKDISETIDESRRVINYHIKLLSQAKLIKVVRSGRETKCYLQVDLT